MFLFEEMKNTTEITFDGRKKDKMSTRLLMGFVITYAHVDGRWRVSTVRLAGDR